MIQFLLSYFQMFALILVLMGNSKNSNLVEHVNSPLSIGIQPFPVDPNRCRVANAYLRFHLPSEFYSSSSDIFL